MNYGYPGSNSQLENHNVSEESFWPSFTDIMMVIVMVFLLVTVAVILNNWALISKLTNSVEAQKAATSLAENRQVKNVDLENKLSTVQQNLLALNKQFEKEKNELVDTEANLKKAAATLTSKEQSLASIENKLNALNEKYETEHQNLENTSEKLTASEEQLSNIDKKLLVMNQQLSNKETIIASLDKKLNNAEALNTKTMASLEAEKKKLENTSLKLSSSEKMLSSTNEKLLIAEALNTKTKASLEAETKKLEINSQKFSASEKMLSSTNEKLLIAEALNANTKASLEAETKKLENNSQNLSASENMLSSKNEKLLIADALNKKTKSSLEAEKKKLADANSELTRVKEVLAKLEKDNQSLVTVSTKQKQEIVEKLQAVDALQTDQNTMDEKLTKLLVSVKSAEQTIETNKKSHAQIEAELLEKLTFLQSKNEDQNKVLAENKVAQAHLENKLEEKSEQLHILREATKPDNSLEETEALLAETQKQVEEKNNIIKKLTQSQESGFSQLRSLQGEYDSLDSKYQKLLLPARSSKGKFIASVTYKKSRGKNVIRFKPSPNSSYRTVTKNQLAKSLESLKKKHKEDLYVKVVIPQNSGLSYNEAWKFTINLQRKYDYYYND